MADMNRDPRLATAVHELLTRSGHMRELATEDGVPKLDWVDAVERLLADPDGPEDMESEACRLWDRGIRHIIWAGMGGSVMAVRVMVEMGMSGDGRDGIAIHPLDSTDPAALNRIVEVLAAGKGLRIEDVAGHPATLRQLLSDVIMIGVAMGMTSEEPITHLKWFGELLSDAELDVSEHVLVMALPGSYLDRFARERGAPSYPLQPDGGTGTPGRFSAPGTRVFLLPAALWLSRQSERPGALRAALERTRRFTAGALPDEPPASLALVLPETGGTCRLMFRPFERWRPMIPWIEQLMEESLGKGGKGIVVFDDQDLRLDIEHARSTVYVSGNLAVFFTTLHQPGTGSCEPSDAIARVAELASAFLGWQLTTVLYAYLNEITFVGQPAVENYKARARRLREIESPLDVMIEQSPHMEEGDLTLLLPPGIEPGEQAVAAILADAVLEQDRLDYVDLTFNGEPTAVWEPVWSVARDLANQVLGVPVKLRRAPAAYHSTEQCQMDGPPDLVSLRIICRQHDSPLLGRYDDRFLQAQAVATWQAMAEAGRTCFLLIADGSAESAADAVLRLLRGVRRLCSEQRAIS